MTDFTPPWLDGPLRGNPRDLEIPKDRKARNALNTAEETAGGQTGLGLGKHLIGVSGRTAHRFPLARVWYAALSDVEDLRTEPDAKGNIRPVLSRAALAMAGVLCAYFDEQGHAWPGVESLQRRSGGVDRRTVQRAVAVLERAGWLIRVDRGGRSKTSDYYAAVPGGDQELAQRLIDYLDTRRDRDRTIPMLRWALDLDDERGGVDAADNEQAADSKAPRKGGADAAVSARLSARKGGAGARKGGADAIRTAHDDPLIPPPTPSRPSRRKSAQNRRDGKGAVVAPTTDATVDGPPPPSVSDAQWAHWRTDAQKPPGVDAFDWACFRRNLAILVEDGMGVEAGRQFFDDWQRFSSKTKLVRSMLDLGGRDAVRTQAALLACPHGGDWPYGGVRNIPSAMLKRLRDLDEQLPRSAGTSSDSAADIDQNTGQNTGQGRTDPEIPPFTMADVAAKFDVTLPIFG